MDHQKGAPLGARMAVTFAVRLGMASMVVGLSWSSAAAQQAPPLEQAEELDPRERASDLSFGPVLERNELVEAVLERNPSIASARSAWRAALQEIPQARSLEDPMASGGVAPTSIASSDAPLGYQVEAGQRVPYPGTLRLRGAIAEAEAAAAEQRVEEVRLELATMAALLFDDYYLVERADEINEEHIRLLVGFQSVAAGRYAAGLAPQQAPIQAEVEAAHLLHRRVVLQKERRVVVAQLNALLHREPRAPLPAPSADLAAEEHEPPQAEALEEMALARRPEMLELRAETEARRQAVALEELAFRPNFDFMTSYNSMWGTPEHRWMVGVGVNVPIRRGRIRAAVAESEARLAETESRLARLTDEVRAEVEIALASLDEAAHVVSLYRDRVLPAARDGIAAARAGFETGAATMLDLIDAERTLRTAELTYYTALADHRSRRAELDRALGRLPLTAGGGAGPAAIAQLKPDEEPHHANQ